MTLVCTDLEFLLDLVGTDLEFLLDLDGTDLEFLLDLDGGEACVEFLDELDDLLLLQGTAAVLVRRVEHFLQPAVRMRQGAVNIIGSQNSSRDKFYRSKGDLFSVASALHLGIPHEWQLIDRCKVVV